MGNEERVCMNGRRASLVFRVRSESVPRLGLSGIVAVAVRELSTLSPKKGVTAWQE